MKNYSLLEIQADKKQINKIFINFLKPYSKKGILILIVLIINTFASVTIPYQAKIAIDNNILNKNYEGLVITILVIISLVILDVFSRYTQTRLLGNLGQNLLFEIRKNLFNKIQDLPMSFFAQNKSGDIITRITTDVENINRMISEGVLRILSVVFTMVGITIFMFSLNYELSILAILSLIFIIVFLAVQSYLFSKYLKKAAQLESDVASQIQETFNGFNVIKSFNKSKYFFNLYFIKAKKYFNTQIKLSTINALGNPVIEFFTRLSLILILSYSLVKLLGTEISVGVVVAFLVYLRQFYQPVTFIGNLWRNIQTGVVSIKRIGAILSLDSDVLILNDNVDNKNVPIRGKVEFKNVSFSYIDKVPVLENINFTVNPGETVAIVGPTGGGKTTFVNLIARLYDVNQGNIYIDNKNIKEWDIFELRNNIGYLLQDTFLFEDTVLNNLRYVKEDLSEDEAIKLINELAGVEFLPTLVNGINTKLDGNGANLSSGQKQIISIARIILKKPKILILDEATSNIDSKLELTIQKAIINASKDCTTFIIAHRLSTIKSANKIILIQNNKILEQGSKEELLKLKGKFYRMYEKSYNLTN